MKVERVPLGAPWTGDHRKRKPVERVGFCYRCGKGPRCLFPHPTSGKPKLQFCNGCCDILRDAPLGILSRRQLAREYQKP